MSTFFRNDSFLKGSLLLGDRFLDINTLPRIPILDDDEPYVIAHGYAERPDLLSYALYENSRLWWVFALRNPDVLVDPIRDFKAGTLIYLPNSVTVDNILKYRGS
jgi:hypothetical protein